MTNEIRNGSVLILIALIFLLPVSYTSSLNAKPVSKLKIIDYQNFLNSKFKKKKRISTKYIIIHTSEAGKVSTLRTLSGGKRVSHKRRTKGGHANYTILRDGRIYRILDHRYRADHTGLSMWNGVDDLSSHSIGIELVGYHYGTITFDQYRSLTPLLKELQGIYNIPDKNILTHSQVSYGKPNLWYRNDHRGRKRCALNFNRARAGLTERWDYDPDVRSGRLTSDYQTKRIFYTSYSTGMVKITPERKEAIAIAVKAEEEKMEAVVLSSNIISKDNTAWNIAGEDYNDPETVYILPGGRRVHGDRAGSEIGWSSIPTGTRILLNQPERSEETGGPVYTIGGGIIQPGALQERTIKMNPLSIYSPVEK